MTFNPQNILLSELEPAVAMRFAKRLDRVALKRGETVQLPGTAVEWVWFPEDCLVSTTADGPEGDSASGSLIGSDGTFGAFEACGSRTSFMTATVVIAGASWRIRSEHYRELFDQSSGLRTALHKHIEALLVEARLNVACTALHRVGERMCRMLLEASERSHGGLRLTLTQEAMANALGVQRSTVAATASALQKQGLVRTRRGTIELLDIEALSEEACSCREAINIARDEIHASTAKICEA